MHKLLSIDDYGREAARKLPRIIADYLEGGALDGVSVESNRGDLRALRLRQRIMRDVSDIDVRLPVMGQTLSVPMMIAPMGLLPMFHPDGEVGAARAAHEAGTVFVHSAWSGAPLDVVAAAAPGSVWAQVNLWRDERLVDKRLEQAARANVDVLVLAGDSAAAEKRERDIRNGFGWPVRPGIRGVLNAARKARWTKNFLFGEKLTFGDQQRAASMSLLEMVHFLDENENRAATWRDLARLCDRWPGKVVVKGIMCGDDALAARDAGVDGVYVSNHGGRHFDAQPSTAAVLGDVVRAVGGDIDVLVDGGIRRGADVVKLHALGAKACLIGRPAVYGLTVGGTSGLAAVLKTLTDETIATLACVGTTSLTHLDRSVLGPGP